MFQLNHFIHKQWATVKGNANLKQGTRNNFFHNPLRNVEWVSGILHDIKQPSKAIHTVHPIDDQTKSRAAKRLDAASSGGHCSTGQRKSFQKNTTPMSTSHTP